MNQPNKVVEKILELAEKAEQRDKEYTKQKDKQDKK